MMKILSMYRAHIIMGLTFFLFNACVKESNVGSGLLTDDQLLSHTFVDTVSIQAITLEMDSFNTTGLSKVALGEINDADFGLSSAGFVSEINLPGNNFTFGSDAVIDSVVFTLKYIDVYGDEGQEHLISVSQLDEPLNDTLSYYSDNNVTATVVLGDTLVSFNSEDSITGPDGIENNILAIKLNSELADQIMSVDGGLELAADDAFHDYLKGIKVNIVSGGLAVDQGSMARFSLHDPDSRIIVYYTSNASSLSAEFPINSSAKSYIFADYDYSSMALVENQLLDTLSNFDQYALSGIGGVKTRLSFPFINELQGQSLAIAKAQLVLPKGRTSSVFENPSEIWIQNISTTLYTASSDENFYYIDITEYLQQVILNEQSSNYLDLVISDYFENISRTIINGPLNEEPLKLSIDFTEF
jgi:hypothetical protein